MARNGEPPQHVGIDNHVTGQATLTSIRKRERREALLVLLGMRNNVLGWYDIVTRMTVIDDYLLNVEPAKRKELERIRMLAKKIVPDAEEAIAYTMPTLTYQGKPFLGFDAHKHHIGIYPSSGQVIETLKDQLHDYALSKGAIHVPLDHPVSEELLKQLIDCRLKQITTR